MKTEFDRELKAIRRKEKNIKTIEKKALFVIESLVCNDDFSQNVLLSAIYKYSHVANGICSNKHDDWRTELEQEFRNLVEASVKAGEK